MNAVDMQALRDVFDANHDGKLSAGDAKFLAIQANRQQRRRVRGRPAPAQWIDAPACGDLDGHSHHNSIYVRRENAEQRCESHTIWCRCKSRVFYSDYLFSNTFLMEDFIPRVWL
ncbi:hypothetical protein [Methylocystis suflitae]|uniref:hypothetical protein n=1 Tax=Methylocystis suflitae TaxID=2951405 RepID=UPI00210EA730|nr:hypothetical protein [Methylocystis suflitae]MCQ4189632.1 hypothetical protein [Methylocystis suflitae]